MGGPYLSNGMKRFLPILWTKISFAILARSVCGKMHGISGHFGVISGSYLPSLVANIFNREPRTERE